MAQARAEGCGDAKLKKYLDGAERSGHRAKDLIQEMLTFSRGQRGEPRSLQLGPQLTDTVKLVQSSLPSSVEIRTEFANDVPCVLLDPESGSQPGFRRRATRTGRTARRRASC